MHVGRVKRRCVDGFPGVSALYRGSLARDGLADRVLARSGRSPGVVVGVLAGCSSCAYMVVMYLHLLECWDIRHRGK